MTQSVIGAVNNAGELFQIEDFPGNLFSLLESQRYIERFSLLLFREDISKLSGFIGYGENGLFIICINYKRPIGHQNFTLAHELGHWLLHNGQSISDNVTNYTWSKDTKEQEANMFAGELLYPEKLFVDTNVFLHVIDSNIYGVADLCKRSGNDITITQTLAHQPQ